MEDNRFRTSAVYPGEEPLACCNWYGYFDHVEYPRCSAVLGSVVALAEQTFCWGSWDFPVQFFHRFSSGHVVRREAAPARGPSSALVVGRTSRLRGSFHAPARRRGDRDDGTLREQLILILGLMQPWFRAGSADLAEVWKCEKPFET